MEEKLKKIENSKIKISRRNTLTGERGRVKNPTALFEDMGTNKKEDDTQHRKRSRSFAAGRSHIQGSRNQEPWAMQLKGQPVDLSPAVDPNEIEVLPKVKDSLTPLGEEDFQMQQDSAR